MTQKLPFSAPGEGSNAGAISSSSAHLVANPSIGEVSLGASLSMGSACHLEDRAATAASEEMEEERDHESASHTAIAGTSRTVSLSSSYILGHSGRPAALHHHHHRAGGATAAMAASAAAAAAAAVPMSGGGGEGGSGNTLEVDVHSGVRAAGKKAFSASQDRLSSGGGGGGGETASLSGRSATVSLSADNDGAASTRGLAGSILAYRLSSHPSHDNGSVNSYRTVASGDQVLLTTCGSANPSVAAVPIASAADNNDGISLRSLPVLEKTTVLVSHGQQQPQQQRSLSPVSNFSGDELASNGGGSGGGGSALGGAARRSTRRGRPHLDKQVRN